MDTASAVDGGVSDDEVGPGSDLGEGLTDSLKDGRTVDYDLVCVVAVPVHPLSGSMNNTFGPMRSPKSNLDGFVHVLDLALHEFERDFAREQAEGFTDRDGPEGT